MTLAIIALLATLTLLSSLTYRLITNLHLHPLSKFPGPWYTALSSLPLATISLLKLEPQWLLHLTRRYSHSDIPIRIAPTLLLFPKPSSINDIYWDSKNNTKGGLYSSGVIGPPSLGLIVDGEEHRALRKALGGAQWGVGALRGVWEEGIDGLVGGFCERMKGFAERGERVVLCDKVAGFAADVMTLVTFGEPWGFVENSRDERHIIASFRESLALFGFAGRCRGFRDYVLRYPPLARFFLPTASDDHGIGYLIGQARVLVTEREGKIEEEGFLMEKPDFMYALEATIDGHPLTLAQKHAQVLLMIQAGADTTGTALGSTLNYLLTHPSCLSKLCAEIDKADAAGLLSTPIQYEQTQKYLPYMIACIKEGGLRLRPPATNLFTRVAGPGGAKVGSVYVPEGFEMTTNAYVVHRDLELFGPDAEEFRPERWLEGDEKRLAEMEAGMFAFGAGPRVCMGRNIAMFELYKLLPEIVRRFDMELVREGRYVVVGGVAYNEDLVVSLRVRGGRRGV